MIGDRYKFVLCHCVSKDKVPHDTMVDHTEIPVSFDTTIAWAALVQAMRLRLLVGGQIGMLGMLHV